MAAVERLVLCMFLDPQYCYACHQIKNASDALVCGACQEGLKPCTPGTVYKIVYEHWEEFKRKGHDITPQKLHSAIMKNLQDREALAQA